MAGVLNAAFSRRRHQPTRQPPDDTREYDEFMAVPN
jgi:hypothetical protein